MIVPIVEGHAERESIPLFVRRILYDLQIFDLSVRQGIRVQRNLLVKEQEFERKIEYARRQPGATAVMVLIDADDACPAHLGPRLLHRGAPVAADLPLSVVLAKVELEAWFIAGIESLRGVAGIRADATPPDNPEGIGDAKGWLTRNMAQGRTYIPVDDQATLAAKVDYEAAAGRSRSLRKFLQDLAAIVARARGAASN